MFRICYPMSGVHRNWGLVTIFVFVFMLGKVLALATCKRSWDGLVRKFPPIGVHPYVLNRSIISNIARQDEPSFDWSALQSEVWDCINFLYVSIWDTAFNTVNHEGSQRGHYLSGGTFFEEAQARKHGWIMWYGYNFFHRNRFDT